MTEIMDVATAENRDLTVDEQTTYDATEVELDKIEARIERDEKHTARAAAYDQVDRTGVIAPDGTPMDSESADIYKRPSRSSCRTACSTSTRPTARRSGPAS
jgi:hypothetical protein